MNYKDCQRSIKIYNIYYLQIDKIDNRFKMSPNKPPTIMMSEARS